MVFPINNEYIESKLKEFKLIEKLDDNRIKNFIAGIMGDREDQIIVYLNAMRKVVHGQFDILKEKKQ